MPSRDNHGPPTCLLPEPSRLPLKSVEIEGKRHSNHRLWFHHTRHPFLSDKLKVGPLRHSPTRITARRQPLRMRASPLNHVQTIG